MSRSIKRRQLNDADFQIVSAVENVVLEHYKISRESLSDDQHKILDKYLGDFKKLAKKKWNEVNSSLAKLDRNHSTWLQSCVEVPNLVASKSKSTSGGRPAKEFRELSTRSRDRVTAPLREQNTGEQGRIHGNPVADGLAGAVMRKPIAI